MTRSAVSVADMLRQAAQARGIAERFTVLVTSMAGLIEAEALATSVAAADAATGRRVLLMDVRPSGRLRSALVPRRPVALLIAFGNVLRAAYHVDVGSFGLTVLPNDPGEDEAVARALAGSGVARETGFDGFDTVVVIGAGIEHDAGSVLSGADLVLIALPDGAAAADLVAAARGLSAVDRGRSYGAVVMATEGVGGGSQPSAAPGRTTSRCRTSRPLKPGTRRRSAGPTTEAQPSRGSIVAGFARASTRTGIGFGPEAGSRIVAAV